MCVRGKKPLLACASAMYSLIFPTNSNLFGNVNIVNGKGRGGLVTNFKNLSKPIKTMTNNDYFLNHLNGDMYQYQSNIEQWICTTNCGFYSIQAYKKNMLKGGKGVEFVKKVE